MRKKKLFWQLYISNFLVILLALLAFTLLTSYSFKSILLDQVSEDLVMRAALMRDDIMQRLRSDDVRPLQTYVKAAGERAKTRITVIAEDGTVLADSWHDPALMDNHLLRPEVQQARTGQRSMYTRYSNTLNMNTMYAAVKLSDGAGDYGVLRTAVPLHTVEQSVTGLQWQIIVGGLIIALFAGLLSLSISRRITRPIEVLKQGARRFSDGDLDFRLPVPKSEELRDLAVAMNTMAGQLRERLLQITQQHGVQDAVLSSMVEGVIAFDMQERLINVNHSAARLLRIDIEKSRGKAIQEVVRNAGLQRFVEETLAAGHATEGYISIVDEIERFLQVHGSILRDVQDAPIGVVVVMNDYTELRNLEKVRREFVANVSHELKTPITSIKGFVETLLDGAMHDREDAERFLGIVARQADRLNAIIEDLLSLSRVEQGSERDQHVVLSEAPLRDVVLSAVQSCQMDADAKNMRIETHADTELSAMMNQQLLEQVLINLVGNAIKYSDEGKTITVAVERNDAKEILLTVRDQGYGIEAEHLPRLFERFYRVDKARSRTLGGTGLGLSIVKHIVQAHNGRIDVRSTPGEGSTFVIILPAASTVAVKEDKK
ncbi:MAG: HAMP domain-containing protein [Bacteroidetes bacterium]|nr:HAMP domain-containing protein [Bacteroidota bacterium]